MQNVRWRPGYLYRRGGIVDLSPTGIAAGTCRGLRALDLAGTVTRFVAQRVTATGKTSVYSSTGVAFTEITASSGKYGDTRLVADGDVAFVQATDSGGSDLGPFSGRTGRHLVVASNGQEVLVHDPVAATVARAVRVGAMNSERVTQQRVWPDFWDVSSCSSPASSGGGASCTLSQAVPATSGLAPRWRFAAAVSGDSAEATFTGAGLASGTTLQAVVSTSSAGLALRVKWEVYDGTVWRVLYDPATDFLPFSSAVDASKTLVSFRIDPTVAPDSTYTKLRLTWLGPNSGATDDVYLIAMAGGGKCPSSGSHGVSWFNSGSRCESAGVVCRDLGASSLPGVEDPRNNVVPPVFVECSYSYNVRFPQVTDAARDAGVDHALVYVSYDDGERQIVAVDVQASYAGSWAHTGGRTASALVTVGVNTPEAQFRRFPREWVLPVPPFTYAAAVGGRIVVCGGTVGASGAGLKGAVSVSDLDDNFRYSESDTRLPDGTVDPTAAYRHYIPGERPMAVERWPGTAGDDGVALVLGERMAYRLLPPSVSSGPTMHPVGEIGTKSPRSVVALDDFLLWVTHDRRMVRIGPGGQSDLSTGVVEGILDAIDDARLPYVCSGTSNGTVYVAYSIAGATRNATCLAYDKTVGLIYRDVTTAGTGIEYWSGASDRKTFAGVTGGLYTYDDQAQGLDIGTEPVRVVVRPGAMVPQEPFATVRARRIGVVCTSHDTDTMTAELYGPLGHTGGEIGVSDSAVIEAHGSLPGLCYRWFAQDPGFGGTAPWVSVQVYGDVSSAAWKLYELVGEHDEEKSNADV